MVRRGRGKGQGRQGRRWQRDTADAIVEDGSCIQGSNCIVWLLFSTLLLPRPFPSHPPPSTVCNLLTLIVVRAEGEWHLWTRNWIRAWQVSRTHTHAHTLARELSLQHGTCCCGRCNLHLWPSSSSSSSSRCWLRYFVALRWQFRCLSRAFSPDSIWRKCKQRKFAHFLQSKKNQKENRTTFLRLQFGAHLLESLMCQTFPYTKYKLYPKTVTERGKEGEGVG